MLDAYPFSRLLTANLDGEPAAGGATTAPAAPASEPPPAAAPDMERRMAVLESELKDARAEAAKYRTRSRDAAPAALAAAGGEIAKQLAKAMGVDLPADEPADPVSVLAQLQARDKERDLEIRRLKMDATLGDVYAKAGLVPKLARAVLESEGVLAGLDPDDADTPKTLQAAVKKLAEEYPQIKAQPPARIGGTPFPGGSGGDQSLITREKLSRMKPEEIVKAREAGALSHLGAGAG